METNPYAVNEQDIAAVASPTVRPTASRGQRFTNFFIDMIFFQILMLFVGVLMGIVLVVSGDEDWLQDPDETRLQLLSNGLSFVSYLAYYTLFEWLFGATVGKWLSGTRVVDAEGNRPSVLRCLGRSLCRMIPFEPLSFFSSNAKGWHDTLTKTSVVTIRS